MLSEKVRDRGVYLIVPRTVNYSVLCEFLTLVGVERVKKIWTQLHSRTSPTRT